MKHEEPVTNWALIDHSGERHIYIMQFSKYSAKDVVEEMSRWLDTGVYKKLIAYPVNRRFSQIMLENDD